MRAILSVSDKAGIVQLGRELAGRKVELVSTGGTAKALSTAGLAVTGIADVTGFPEMMDGRVKTLHPAVHAGILARRNRPDDLAAIAAQGIRPVDLVVVNLYPFARAAANADTPFDGLVEEIDIGGPSLVRAAAKNFRDVLVVVDPEDYPRVVEELDRAGGPSLEFRFELMRKAFEHTGSYDMTIATTLLTVDVNDGAMTRRAPLQDPWRQESAALRREPAPGGVLAGHSGIDGPDLAGPPGEGAVVYEPARSRRRRAHCARVPGTCGRRHQAHQPVRRRDRHVALPMPTSARARPIRSRRSAASSPSTAPSTGKRQRR